jgi:hypothetical protein
VAAFIYLIHPKGVSVCFYLIHLTIMNCHSDSCLAENLVFFS